jgi:hypothetical protein
MEFEELLIKVGNILEDLHIPYCITGGYAVSVWGRPRGTFDIDVVVKLEAKNVVPLATRLRSLSRSGYMEEAVARDAIREGKEFNFFHPESGIKLDFWVVKKSDPMDQKELERRIARKIAGHTIYFISPEDLILSKLKWFQKTESTRQLEDIESILKIQKKLDISFLRQTAHTNSTLEILDSVLKPKANGS